MTANDGWSIGHSTTSGDTGSGKVVAVVKRIASAKSASTVGGEINVTVRRYWGTSRTSISNSDGASGSRVRNDKNEWTVTNDSRGGGPSLDNQVEHNAGAAVVRRITTVNG